MDTVRTRVLIVDPDPQAAERLRCGLEAGETPGPSGCPCVVECVTTLADAGLRLAGGGIAVVLLDPGLSSPGTVSACEQMCELAGDAPVLVLAEEGDRPQVRAAMQSGAHGFLRREGADADSLARAVGLAMERRVASQLLRSSEAHFRAISDASPLGILVTNVRGDCTYTNAAYDAIAGREPGEAVGAHWSRFIHSDDRKRLQREWMASSQGAVAFSAEMRLVRSNGDIAWTRLHVAFMIDRGLSQGSVQTVEDITARKAAEALLRQAEEALLDEKERAQVTLASIGDAVLATDSAGRVSYLNRVAESMTGWTAVEASGRALSEVFAVIDGATRAVAANPAQRAIAEDRTVGLAMGCLLVRRDGVEIPIEDSAAPIHDRQGGVSGAVIVFHDVSQSRAMTLRMAHMAQHDFLTGLPNRALLSERLAQAIGQAARHRKQVALLFIDIDFFKRINDSLGHGVGDELLLRVAERLVACVRTTDSVCRQGGDEFVILLAEIEHPQDAGSVAEKLREAFAEPQQVAGHSLQITLSVGISVYPDDGNTTAAIMRNADTAMYHAKAQGRNNCQFFMPEMNVRAVRRLFIESGLRRAIGNGELLLHYQPQIDLASGVVVGAEALLRWQDPDHGLIPPAQFIQVAEECGLIVPIGQWALSEACRQIRVWQSSGLRVVPVAVNISVLELWSPGFADDVARILSESGVPPHLLELELTESRLMQDAEQSMSVLKSLKCIGVQLAIDDFGTGYSCLSYLRRLPFDTLKIDQSFVHDLDSEQGDACIVGAIIGMARHLRQRVIAEGVETAQQLALLRIRRCDAVQGYLPGRPGDADSFARLLARGLPSG